MHAKHPHTQINHTCKSTMHANQSCIQINKLAKHAYEKANQQANRWIKKKSTEEKIQKSRRLATNMEALTT